MNKDIIYIDTDDDITAIISKVKAAKSRVVALVPPKRSSVLSSVVNLKLLHKAGTDQKKRLVLITQESTLQALAGGVEMYVADNLKSPPFIPTIDKSNLDLPSEIIENDQSAPVAEDGEEVEPKAKADKPKKSKSLKPFKKNIKVPNFGSFKKKLLIGGAVLLLLIIAWWQMVYALPRAVVSLNAQTERLETEAEIILDEEAEEVDLEKMIVPASKQTLEKDVKEKFTPTGEKNEGEKATGQITVYNCAETDDVSFAANTAFVASSGQVFLAKNSFTIGEAEFSGGSCDLEDTGKATVAVVAEKPGESYNIGATSYTIRNLSSTSSSNYPSNGGAMSGGTDVIVNFVQQSDIDKAVAKAKDKAKESGIEEVAEQFSEEEFAIEDSYSSKLGKPSSNPAVGQDASSAEITIKVTHSLLGVSRNDINELLTKVNEENITENQSIVDNGLEKAKFTPLDDEDGNPKYQINTVAFTGPKIDEQQIAEAIAGKGFSEAVTLVENIQGVTSADIELSPGYVFSVPKRADNIEIKLIINER